MGIFGNSESKEDKKAMKENELLARFGLHNITDPKDKESCRKIVSTLVGTGAMETGMKLSMAKAEEQLKVSYLHAIMEQNWIIIRQLDKLTGDK